MKTHFISGLPRSGSTLLSAILKQNPRFHAGITSPVSTLFRAIENSTNRAQETSVFISDKEREHLLKSIFAAYYGDSKKVVFDTSRMWCARLPLLAKLFPDSKMIVMVREIGWILDSFEKLYRKNNMQPSAIYNWDTNGTVYSRTSALAEAGGTVGYAINAAREAVGSPEANKRLMLIDYEQFTKHPEISLRKLYDFLGEKWFEHDFANIEYEEGEFDRALGAEGLHTVKGAVAWKPRKTILPADLFEQFNGPNFWKK